MSRNSQDIDSIFARGRKLLDTLAADDPERLHAVGGLAYAVHEMLDHESDLRHYDEIINMMSKNFDDFKDICQPDGYLVALLATILYERYAKTKDVRDLDETIALMQSVLPETANDALDATERLTVLQTLGRALFDRYQRNLSGNNTDAASKDLRDAIRFSRLLILIDQRDEYVLHFTVKLSEMCFTASRYFKDSSFLDEAIRHLEKLHNSNLQLDGEDRSSYLMYWSDLLWQRYTQDDNQETLDQSIQRGKDAFAITSGDLPHPFLNYLAKRLATRYSLRKVEADLDDSIKFDQLAISLVSKGDPALADYLLHLGVRCQIKHRLTEDLKDLDAAILVGRQTVEVTIPGHPRRMESLNNLGLLIYYRFERKKSDADLEESLKHLQEAVALSTPGTVDWRRRLSNLIISSSSLLSRQSANPGASLKVSINKQEMEHAINSTVTMVSNAFGVASLLEKHCPLRLGSSELDAAISLAREGFRATEAHESELPGRMFLLGRLLTTKAKGTSALSDLELACQHWKDAGKIDNPPTHYTPEIFAQLSKVLLLKHSVQDDAECSVLLESLQTASSAWMSSSPENPNRNYYQALMQQFPMINANPVYAVNKHACPNCEELRAALMQPHDVTPEKVSMKKMGYDRATGKLVPVPFSSEELALLPTRQRAIVGSSSENASVEIPSQVSSLQDMRDAEKRGVYIIDSSMLKDKAPLPDQAEIYHERFTKSGSMADLGFSISIQEFVLKHTKLDNPKLHIYQSNMAVWLHERHQKEHNPEDLDAAIEIGENAVENSSKLSAENASYLNNLAVFYEHRWDTAGSPEDGEKAISGREKALRLSFKDESLRSSLRYGLVLSLYRSFRISRNPQDLDRVIKLLSELTDSSRGEKRLRDLCLLSQVYVERFQCFGLTLDVDEAIRVGKAALELAQEHPSSPSDAKYVFACAFETKFESSGLLSDLDEAINIGKGALNPNSTLADSTPRTSWLTSLGTWLANRGRLTSNLQDSHESVALCREAVSTGGDSELGISFLLNNLGHCLGVRYHLQGNFQDLYNAIDAAQKARDAKRPESRMVPTAVMPDCIDDLGVFYFHRFQAVGARQDLNQSIKLGKDAFETNGKYWFSGHPRRSQALINISNGLGLRYQRYEDPSDLTKAIEYALLALKDCASASTVSLEAVTCFVDWNLEAGERLRDQQFLRAAMRQMKSQLQKAQERDRSARSEILTLISRIHNAQAKLSQSPQVEMELDGARRYALKALNETLPGTGKGLQLLNMLGSVLQRKMAYAAESSKDGLLKEAADYYVRASRCIGAPMLFRIRAGTDAALCFADLKRWKDSAQMYEEVLGLLPLVAPQSIERDDQQYLLADIKTLPSSACAVSLRAGRSAHDSFCRAEAGRGIMASLQIKARTDVSELQIQYPDLFAQYQTLRTRCNQSLGSSANTTQASGSTPSSGYISENISRRREDLRELAVLEGMIRDIPGFEEFHRPFSPDYLKQQASSGPIVSFNVSQWGSDAIIVNKTGEIRSIPLPDLDLKDLEANIQHLIGKDRVFVGLPSTRVERNKRLRNILEWLWKGAVKSVLQALDLLVPIPADKPARPSRIFWLANGLMGSVPLHAAGNFGGDRDCTSKYVVSTYVPTLKSLAFARHIASKQRRADKLNVLVVNAPEVEGLMPLNTKKEIEALAETVRTSQHLSLKILLHPTKQEVLDQVERHSIIHFACHGISCPDNPSNSGLFIAEGEAELRLESNADSDRSEPVELVFEPHVGLSLEILVAPKTVEANQKQMLLPPLKVRDIANLSHENARLAYLSACSTAENSATALIDEVIYVASAFQLAGFPHVISTLWEAETKAAVTISQRFYQQLFQSSHDGEAWNDEEVAYALHEAVEGLKSTGFPNARRKQNLHCDPIAWASFIHIGV